MWRRNSGVTRLRFSRSAPLDFPYGTRQFEEALLCREIVWVGDSTVISNRKIGLLRRRRSWVSRRFMSPNMRQSSRSKKVQDSVMLWVKLEEVSAVFLRMNAAACPGLLSSQTGICTIECPNTCLPASRRTRQSGILSNEWERVSVRTQTTGNKKGHDSGRCWWGKWRRCIKRFFERNECAASRSVSSTDRNLQIEVSKHCLPQAAQTTSSEYSKATSKDFYERFRRE